MQKIFSRTKDTLNSLSSYLEDFNPKEISCLDKLYGYKDTEKTYRNYLDSLALEGNEKLFVDFWYKGNLMGVAGFIPDVDYMLKNVRRIRSKECYDKESAEKHIYSDPEKSSYFNVLVNDMRLRSVSGLIHVKAIPDKKARKLANRLAKPLVRLGYRGKINPGRDLYSVRERLELLKCYAELIEESVSAFGITDKNPALIRARLDISS